jgi:hypothetical protein
VGQK